MSVASSNLNAIWADLLVHELVRHGVRCFCMSSGSRSGPLAVAVARDKDLEPVVHFDERASAFYALGHARATGKPAVWITTSGTAAANGYPAVIEAAQDHVPLLLLTADRPPELRDTRANQTIDQVNIFGAYARWQVDMPCPDVAVSPTYVLTTVAEAVARATGADAGPVQVNTMFREPLSPQSDGTDYTAYLAQAQSWLDGDAPFTERGEHLRTPTPATMETVAKRIGQAENGLLVIGRLENEADQRAARELARMLPWPAFVDMVSGLRLGAQQTDHIVRYADQILLSPRADRMPDCILHFGGPIISKRIQQYVAECARDADYLQIKTRGKRQDSAHAVRYALDVHFPSFMTALRARNVKVRPARSLKQWQDDSKNVQHMVEEYAETDDALDEIFLAAWISKLIPETHDLFLSNSMPIRDMDMYAASDGEAVAVGANRGASGIDGTLSSACGWAAGRERPLIAVVGDLACLHDLNALQLVRRSKHPMIVIVVNNNGGGIFSFLPWMEQADIFETCFGTPHDLTFEHAARQFELPYAYPATRDEFKSALDKALSIERSCLIEVRTDRAANRNAHDALQQRIREALQA